MGARGICAVISTVLLVACGGGGTPLSDGGAAGADAGSASSIAGTWTVSSQGALFDLVTVDGAVMHQGTPYLLAGVKTGGVTVGTVNDSGFQEITPLRIIGVIARLVSTGTGLYVVTLDAGNLVTYRFDGSGFVEEGDAVATAGTTLVTWSHDGGMYAAYATSGPSVTVVKRDGTAWQPQGSPLQGRWPMKGASYQGMPAMFAANSDGTQAELMTFDGANWTTVPNTTLSAAVLELGLASTEGGDLYLQLGPNENKLYRMGSSGWQTVQDTVNAHGGLATLGDAVYYPSDSRGIYRLQGGSVGLYSFESAGSEAFDFRPVTTNTERVVVPFEGGAWLMYYNQGGSGQNTVFAGRFDEQ